MIVTGHHSNMRDTILICAVLVVSLFELVIPSHGNSIEYMVSPSNKIATCRPVAQCFTLSQFAANSKSYLEQNTTLILQPGNHTLDSVFMVSNVSHFSMKTMMASTVNIACTQSGKLMLQTVQSAHIEDIFFIHCVGNKVTHVNYLMLSRLTFLGPSLIGSGTAIELNGTNALVHQCSFLLYLYGSFRSAIGISPYIHSLEESRSWIGGAMIVSNSNVSIHQSHFNENRAQFGGAVYAIQSNITISDAVFDFNSANSSDPLLTASGGALYAVNTTISIINTSLARNQVYYGYTLGGAVATINSNLTITNSLIIDNQAMDLGGGLYAMFSEIAMINCTCRTNKAASGGSFATNGSTLMALYSYIGDNRAHTKGGVIFATHSIVMMNFTLVRGNYAPLGGGMYGSASLLKMKSSSFLRNGATDSGGVVYCQKNCEIVANESMFMSNTAEQRGGVVNMDQNCYVMVSRCEVINNTASYGGFISTSGASNAILINKSEVRYNMASIGGGAILATKSIVYITNTSFTMNRAQVGGVLRAEKSRLTSISCLFSNNSATMGGVMDIVACNASLTNVSIISNMGKEGTFLISQSIVNFMNHTTVLGNIGSIIAINSSLNLFGYTVFKDNDALNYMFFPNPVQSGGALTLIHSDLTLRGPYAVFINNSAINGGAIHATMSKVSSKGRLLALRNAAKRSGGAVYLKDSELWCNGTMQYLNNTAVKRGGGVDFVSSSVHLNSNCSLLFDKNWAAAGSGIIMDST